MAQISQSPPPTWTTTLLSSWFIKFSIRFRFVEDSAVKVHSINPSLVSSFHKQQVYILIKVLQHDTNKGFCVFAPSFSFFPLIPKELSGSIPPS